jgi:hypothetical protein
MKWTYMTPDFRKVNVKSFTKVYSTNTVGIYDINQDKRFVLKVIKSPKLMPQFYQELKYGTMKILKNEQIRVHAFATHGRLGAYVMDHVSFGDKNVVSMTAEEYMDSSLFDKKNFSKKFFKSLKQFYKTFGGFHGDLHAENVMVNVQKNDGLLKNVVIIDYANIQPFRRMGKKVLQDVHTAFMRIRSEGLEEYPPGSGIPVKWVNEIPVRSNKNMLSKLEEWRRLK